MRWDHIPYYNRVHECVTKFSYIILDAPSKETVLVNYYAKRKNVIPRSLTLRN